MHRDLAGSSANIFRSLFRACAESLASENERLAAMHAPTKHRRMLGTQLTFPRLRQSVRRGTVRRVSGYEALVVRVSDHGIFTCALDGNLKGRKQVMHGRNCPPLYLIRHAKPLERREGSAHGPAGLRYLDSAGDWAAGTGAES